MINRYRRKAVLRELFEKALSVCDRVFTSSRPTATEKMERFIVSVCHRAFLPMLTLTTRLMASLFVLRVTGRAA